MNKFLKIFQVLIFLSIVFLLSFNVVLAVKHFPVLSTGADVLSIDFDERGCVPDPDNDQYCQINWIGTYIAGIYKYGISLAAVLAVVMVMVGGFIWLSSGGSADRIKTAKNYIGSAFAGLLLALFAFVILNTINPRLVNLDPLKIAKIKNVESKVSEDAPVEISGETFFPGCCADHTFIGNIKNGSCIGGIYRTESELDEACNDKYGLFLSEYEIWWKSSCNTVREMFPSC